MIELLVVVGSLALADSLNPSTLVPAVYLATQPGARMHLIGFTLGVFGVSTLAGLVIAFGPGALILGLVPHPGAHTRHVLEVIGGAIALGVAMVLWRLRGRSAPTPRTDDEGRSSLILGATIMAIELPTAIPYLAALALIVGADRGAPETAVLIAEYNVLFVGPLLGIIAAHVIAPKRTEEFLRPIGDWLRRYAVLILAALLATAGTFAVYIGVHGLVVR